MNKTTCLVLTVFLSFLICVSPINAETVLSYSPNPLVTEQALESYVKVLCSEAFGGRKTGSFGNELTTEWLSGMLKGIGITPYENNDYRISFTTQCYNFEQLEMTVYEKGGGVRKFVPGKDFYISLTSSFNIKLTSKDILFMSSKDAAQEITANYIFKEVDAFNATKFMSKRDPEYIQVTNETFNYLVDAEIDYIHIVNEVSMEEKTVYNVVGTIPGINSDKAVILSAHFDHMGQLGNSLFQGAVDNASGTAALLYLAELLLQKSEETPFDFDIVFAFLNDEENGLRGGMSLAPELKSAYQSLININIDCVGIWGIDNTYSLASLKYATLVDDIKLYMDKYGISYDNETSYLYLSSDGRTFEINDIPTVSFITSETTGLIHTTLDTWDKLDYTHIATLCRMIAEFVANNGSKVYEAKISQSVNAFGLPDEIFSKFTEAVEKVRAGDESHINDELLDYMPGQTVLYTYYDYLQITEKLSVLRDIDGYYLGFIHKPRTLPITRLMYLKHTPDTNLNAMQISLATYFTYDHLYQLLPIEGMEGYFSVATLRNPELIFGFIYVGDDRNYFFDFGKLRVDSTYVTLGIEHTVFFEPDQLKQIIEELDVEEFVELWKEYNLK